MWLFKASPCHYHNDKGLAKRVSFLFVTLCAVVVVFILQLHNREDNNLGVLVSSALGYDNGTWGLALTNEKDHPWWRRRRLLSKTTTRNAKSNDHNLEFYFTTHPPICTSVPKTRTTTAFLSWQRRQRQPSSNGVLLLPWDLQRGILTRPHHPRQMQHFLEKLYNNKDSNSNHESILNLVLLTSDTSKEASFLKELRSWSTTEQHVVAFFKSAGIQLNVSIHDINDVTLSLEKELSPTTNQQQQGPTLIIDLVASQRANKRLDSAEGNKDRMIALPTVQNTLRDETQTYMRWLLETVQQASVNQCQTSDDSTREQFPQTGATKQPQQPPLVVFMQEFNPHLKRGVLSDTLYTRVFQRLCDWYDTNHNNNGGQLVSPICLSWDKVVRPLLYNQRHAEVDELLASYSPVHLLGYALMDWIIEYCSKEEESSSKHDNTERNQKQQGNDEEKSSFSILNPGVQDLVNQVLPPPLDASLGLSHVSERWRRQGKRERACDDLRRPPA